MKSDFHHTTQKLKSVRMPV